MADSIYESIDVIEYNNIRSVINQTKNKIMMLRIRIVKLQFVYKAVIHTAGSSQDLTQFQLKFDEVIDYLYRQIEKLESYVGILNDCCARYRDRQEQAIQEGILVGTLRHLEMNTNCHQTGLYL